MKNKLSNLIRKVFLSSLAGIAANNQSLASESLISSPSEASSEKVEMAFKRKSDLSAKLLLKKAVGGRWEFTSHRSHRSHSSHRSHYSSYSGGGSSYTPSRSSSGSSNSSNNSNYKGSSNSANSGTLRLSNTIRFGSRILKKGMKGTDVTELINILLNKGYLSLELGQTKVSGSYTFDTVVETAVKQFQSDYKLENDGVCGPLTIYYLKTK